MGVLENLEIAFPELILAASGLFLLMVGVFLGKNATRIVGGCLLLRWVRPFWVSP